MITKEQIKDLTAKWHMLLGDIKVPKHIQYKFARIYEKIVEHNDPKHVKILLSIAHRIFLKTSDLKSTKSSKNESLLTDYVESELYEGYSFNVANALAFADAVADMAIEEIQKVGRFSHLLIKDNHVFFIY